MHKLLRKVLFTAFTLGLVLVTTFVVLQVNQAKVSAQNQEGAGALTVIDGKGKARSSCPLQHTDVKAEISGFLSRVRVTQHFTNPFKEKIEAVYTFPLPQNAAVDDMTMVIGERTIKGKILPREQAQAVYDSAKANGQVASLLDQERPNIFTQSVANILPGEQIKITISYVEQLKYEAGSYEFVFPMVVGPRYIPGNAVSTSRGNGLAPDTDQVNDASRITPKMRPPSMRSGHDISVEVSLDAGLLMDKVASNSHQIAIDRPDGRSAKIKLASSSTIPNKDFVLKFDVADAAIQDALLTHRSDKGGFFTMILQPPDRVVVSDVAPKELVFVLDTSGSMEGFPIEKAKETMKLALDSLYPSDTFNLITFAGDTNVLFPKPVPATPVNMRKAQQFLADRSGGGGTEMMTAIKTALEPSDNQNGVRIVCFMTDGYVGNEMEIISEIQKHQNARIFAFGIGNSVNQFLLDKMAETGRGEVEYVSLSDEGSAAAKRFHERVRNPLLTDISVDWNGLPVADVYPQRIPDLFSAKPVVLSGRFTSAANGTIRLKGKLAGSEFVREISVSLPETMASHDVLASLWARRRIDDLMSQDYSGMQRGEMKPELKQTITQIGLEYRLMTQFTSFVAVQETIVTDGGQPRTIEVPVEVPEGVKQEMVDKDTTVYARAARMSTAKPMRAQVMNSRAISGRIGSGSGAGMAPPPQPSPLAGMISTAVVDAPEPEKKTPEETRFDQLRPKSHPSVLAVMARLKNTQLKASADEQRFVRDDKAEIQVWLTEKNPESLKQLQALGFEVILNSKSSQLVIGRISISKLEALVELKFVRYVSPQLK